MESNSTFFVNEISFPVNYVIGIPSIYDILTVTTLAQAIPLPHILGDKDYRGQRLKEELSLKDMTLSTPLRKSMKDANKQDNRLLGNIRKQIETVFQVWKI